MRLTTIWTMPAMDLAERLRRTADTLAMQIAWRLPERVVYWGVVRAAVKVEPNLSPEKVTAVEMMESLRSEA
jgi:hypothetical protein